MEKEDLHESVDLLSAATLDMHRALVSLKEELDAVDWYTQRAEVCTDPALCALLTHNKNEEVEHAMMLLEWIRRTNPTFDQNTHRYLNSTGSITAVEATAKPSTPGPVPSSASASLGIGSLKG